MDKTLLITCPKCGHRINGRLWRCPQCGDSDNNHKPEKIKKSHQKFWSRIITAWHRRKTKAV